MLVAANSPLDERHALAVTDDYDAVEVGDADKPLLRGRGPKDDLRTT